MKQFSTWIVCHHCFFFRVGKKARKSLIQTSVSVYCHTGHSLKLSRSFCHSCIGYLYQNNRFQLKGKSHLVNSERWFKFRFNKIQVQLPGDFVEPLTYSFEIIHLNNLSKPFKSSLKTPCKIFGNPLKTLSKYFGNPLKIPIKPFRSPLKTFTIHVASPYAHSFP